MITGYIFGDKETIARLQAMPGKARVAIKATVQRLTLRLLTKVKMEKLTGQVLNVRTGRLRNSINQRVTETQSGVFGSVGTNVEYARVHEMGGTVTVKAHTRLIKQAFGKPLRYPVWQTVKAHTVKYPERSFLRSALKEMEPEIREQLQQALTGAMR